MPTPRQRKKQNPVGNVDDYNKYILEATIKNLELSINSIRTKEELLKLHHQISVCKELLKRVV